MTQVVEMLLCGRQGPFLSYIVCTIVTDDLVPKYPRIFGFSTKSIELHRQASNSILVSSETMMMMMLMMMTNETMMLSMG